MLLSIEFSYQEDILHAPALFWTSGTIASPRFVPLDKTGAKGLAFPVDGIGTRRADDRRSPGTADRRQRAPTATGARILLPASPFRPIPVSGIRHSSTKPTTNSTAMDSTPMDELPVSCVNTLTRNVPMTAAYLPKMSKKP